MTHSQERALEVIEFIQMLHHTGDFHGKLFRLLDWQYEIIRDVYGTVNEKGYRQYQYAYLEVPKKNGKALALDTPIPTPSGWTTMGALCVGDSIFDENGDVCHITFATEVMYGHPCYEVQFSDGSSIVADAEHNWLIITDSISSIMTTSDIAGALKNSSVLQLPEVDISGISTRYITGAVAVESVPVRCIQVDSPSHLYLAGLTMIPTHNTEMTAGLASYHLFNDPPSGQIYCCAAEKEQASLVYQAAKQMIEQDKILQKLVNIIDSKKMIVNKHTGTFIKVLSAEAYSKHGINPTVVIFDELHAQQSRDLWDTMTFGAGAARKEPLWWVITTAGEDPDRLSIGWEVHEYARKIIDKELVDPIWYAKIYHANDDDDIFSEEVWYNANPSLDYTIDIEKVRQEAIGARNDLGKERLFRWLRLNQWISVKKLGWLSLTLWDANAGKWNISELTGKKCYVGLDLSSTTDLTALVLLFPPQQGIDDWRMVCEAWIPEDKMKERRERDNVPYERWVSEHHLHTTPGDAVDYDFVEARIIALSKQYKFESVCPDPWNSHMLTQRLTKEGLNVIEIPQDMKNMSPAMKETERLLRTNMLTHDSNPVARWCFGNVNIAIDGNENIKPMKNKSRDRIDIIVALINAMSRAIRIEKILVYEKRGMRTLM